MTLALHVSGPFRVFYTQLQFGCLCAAEVPLSQCWAGLTELTSHLLFWGCQPCWGSSSPGRAHLHAPSLPLPAVSTAEARYHPACSHLPLQSPPPSHFSDRYIFTAFPFLSWSLAFQLGNSTTAGARHILMAQRRWPHGPLCSAVLPQLRLCLRTHLFSSSSFPQPPSELWGQGCVTAADGLSSPTVLLPFLPPAPC